MLTPTSDQDRVCKGCGVSIPQSRAKQARYCSEPCKDKVNGAKTRANPKHRAAHVAYHREWHRKRYANDPEYRAHRVRLSRNQYHQCVYGRQLDTPDDILKFAKDKYKAARVLGYRSGLEVKNAAHLRAHGVEGYTDEDPANTLYEKYTLRYTVPERVAKYTPDYPLLHNGIIVESKGVFVTSDRQKHILIANEHPDLDVRFVFSNPNTRISKTSATTYAMWAEKHGFKYAKQLVPVTWLNEKPEPRRIAAMRKALGL